MAMAESQSPYTHSHSYSPSQSQSQSQSHKKKKRKKTNVVLDLVPVKEGYACPFVGYFSSGFDSTASTASETGDSSDSLEVKGYQNSEKYRTRQHQLVVTPPGDGHVDFVGANYLGEGAIWQPGNYALGIFDKDSNTLQLLPIAGSKVLRMEPRVRGLDYDGESMSGTLDVEISKEMMLQKRNLLTSTFGTHKSRIWLNRIERGRVKDDALGDKDEIGKLFEKAGDNVAVLTSEEALQQANAAINRNIPPYDLTATVPENVYIFEKIITPEEQRSLNDIDILKAAAGNPEKIQELQKERAYPDFVLRRLNNIRSVQDSVKNKRVVILSYMRHLLTFYNLPRHVINSLVDPHGDQQSSRAIDLKRYANIPDAVVAKILKLFTSINQGGASASDSRSQSADKRNLLISYILVLGLMIDNFRADPYDLAVELRMSISHLKPHYMELGCKFKSVKESDRGVVDLKSAQRLYEAVLPVPLQFPSLKDKLKKRR